MSAEPDDALLAEIEQVAFELATLGGAECRATLGSMLNLAYKGDDPGRLTDPVSEVDQRVESMIRARLDERFPDHDIIGEEVTEHTGRGSDWIWAIDPIDGTTNFVNGFPLFASSIGVLYRGRPVVGAIWCSTGHRLDAGVYHARAGGELNFDGAPAGSAPNPAVQRRLAGLPEAVPKGSSAWESRKTGSAAIECAFVALGILEVSRLAAPNIWDVAGGLALVQAAAGRAVMRGGDGWHDFETFMTDSGDLREWRNPLILGEPHAVSAMVGKLN